jgi:hypothetical protein
MPSHFYLGVQLMKCLAIFHGNLTGKSASICHLQLKVQPDKMASYF